MLRLNLLSCDRSRRRVVVGEAGDLVPGLGSSGEEGYRYLVTEAHLGLGFAKQREPAAVP